MKVEHMDQLADFIARSLAASADSTEVKREVTEWRKQFTGVHYTVDLPN
jgi:glycine hydroxymethyltransferase